MLETSVSTDSQVLLLLCSATGLPKDDKPLSVSEWNGVATLLRDRELRPADLMGRSASDLRREVGIDAQLAERVTRLLDRGGQLALELERLGSRGIWTITRADDLYPSRWKERLRQAAPAVLFGAGPWPVVQQRTMAIVGSRDVDEAGLDFARRLAAACADAGVAVVSGGARGTDAAAATACVEAGGQAVAVLADSLEKALRNREQLAAIRAQRLSLLTTVHPSAPFSVGLAMGRNKFIYCLADSAVVIASAAETGGTWAGATENLKHGWAPLGVRDEDGVPEGNRRLLARGACSIARDDVTSGNALSEWLSHESGGTPAAPPFVLREPRAEFGVPPANDEEPTPEMAVDAPAAPGAEVPDAAIDTYTLVIERIVRFCEAARTADEVAAAFVLERAQAKAWLARAVEDGILRKRSKPVRYESTSPGLFGRR